MAATFDNRMVDNGTRQATRLDAIQGRYEAHIAHLSGSYSGVMGLPLHETVGLLRQFGLPA